VEEPGKGGGRVGAGGGRCHCGWVNDHEVKVVWRGSKKEEIKKGRESELPLPGTSLRSSLYNAVQRSDLNLQSLGEKRKYREKKKNRVCTSAWEGR